MRQEPKTSDKGESTEKSQVAPPSISLPKGGGAIRGIGEKFAANPVTGTGGMTVPIATSPGRSGFGPQLSLSYDSGGGNGPFGLGWSLSLPSITRKTDKGLPQYKDAEDSDVFILSGAEDLVQEFEKDDKGNWIIKEGEHVIHDKARTVDGVSYRIRRYRPRIEGLFARIERWTNLRDSKDVFWRSLSKDNITTWYGKTIKSRITDPEDTSRIFSWLICETYDDKGNVIVYGYENEDDKGVDLGQAHESNRGKRDDVRRTVNRYIKRIRYGNHAPYLPELAPNAPWPEPPGATEPDASRDWLFEVAFDYGEHQEDTPTPSDAGEWAPRKDPFSTYRSGFEIRTYRRCKRVLMFHHFPGEPEVGANCLVRSTDFTYADEQTPLDTDKKVIKDQENPIYSFLLSVTQRGYQRIAAGGYHSKALPPLEMEYTRPIVQEKVEEVDAESLENLPIGLDGVTYQWTDLHGEGMPGILTEQASAWFYKRNLSPIGKQQVEFAPLELVATKPNVALADGAQFLDLAGDGQLYLVMLDGPMPGLYEHDTVEGWESFHPFTARLNRDTRDPNLKFVDLDGDGHADVLITEDDAFVWHPSLAEEGFGPARRVHQALDEEKGPRLVFNDGEQSIHLADLSGDSLTDIVRIRNGEMCYWPNLGYGRFGAKVTMDNAPWFDNPDQFDHKRVRLADIDGSGTTDIIYLHRDGVRLYFNQSGNSWSKPHILNIFPRVDDLVSIVPIDLLGNGTACLVWSSPLPGDARRQMRYVDLMGGQKPHLLIKTINNLGAETEVTYAPSTKFYLQDKRDGKPWITKLPFPVHCVEKVTIKDKWRKITFTTTYSYHHGCFDGIEREFRGFGRVEQLDVEDYGTFEAGNAASPYITDDKTLYQPPVKTVTWYHTGAFLDRERILAHFAHEYFPHWLEDQHPSLTIAFEENPLPEPDLAAEDLSAEEWREALRACKGMMLRQEVIELDIDALEHPKNPKQLPVKLFSTAYHNCHIHRLQPREENRHAVFLVAQSEAMTYHYELDLRPEVGIDKVPKFKVNPDPRITHSVNLQFDKYGYVLQSVAAVYPRVGKFEDDVEVAKGLAEAFPLINQVQKVERHLAYTETHYTAELPEDLDRHRVPMPCEVMTFELAGADSEKGFQPSTGRYFSLTELKAFKLSETLPHQGTRPVGPLEYHQQPPDGTAHKRVVEWVRMLYFKDDLSGPQPFQESAWLALPYETYKLALTDTLLDAVFKVDGNDKLADVIEETKTARDRLQNAKVSGYLSGADLITRFKTIPPAPPVADLAGQYWIRSGIAGFAADATDHFYLPERYTDPFGNVTTLEYDPRDLFIASTADAMGNITRVTKTTTDPARFNFDYRVLAPREMMDINDNLSEVRFDILGMPCAMAVKGKGTETDNLKDLLDAVVNPPEEHFKQFFVDKKPYDETQAKKWLGNATARHVYYFGEIEEKLEDGKTVIRWGQHPACACGIVRERHVSQLGAGEKSPIQSAFEYSDGMGSIFVKKVQAEPVAKGAPLRWVASGKTILNNKGKPVKQYEPYFSDTGHRFDEDEAQREVGVTSILYYDAPGRVIRTEMPDGSYSRVDFSPWYVRTYDLNDTAFDADSAKRSDWYERRTNPAHPLFAEFNNPENNRAAKLVEVHAGTPSLTILDMLGRDVIAIAHNKVKDGGGVKDEKYLTFTKLDAEGKPLWIRDARKNLVMQYIHPPVPNNQAADPVGGFVPCYDIAGNLLYQHSMDAGDRWMLNDAAGKPMLAWDSRGHTFRTNYDPLHRPIGSFVRGEDPADANRAIQFEKIMYGDSPGNGLTDAQKTKLNLRGKPYQHCDTAGLITSKGTNPVTGAEEAFDFKGNLLRSTRQLVKDYKSTPDWSQNPALENETFTRSTRYDALNRSIQLVAPHSDRAGTKLNVSRPGYNEANLLERVDVWLEQAAEPTTLLDPTTANLKAVTNIDYDAKGQRTRIEYNEGGHPIITEYTYEKETFRLIQLFSTRPKHPEPDKRTLQDLVYTYDPVGNITNIRDEAQQTVFFNNSKIEPSTAYTYDALYRLVHAEGREHAAQNNVQRDAKSFEPIIGIPFPNSPEALQRYAEDYDYDGVGNILRFRHSGGSKERWTRRYQYAPGSNRLLATSLPGDPDNVPAYTATPIYKATYTYDVHGNMTSMPHLPTMEWDFKDQLHATQRQVVNNGGSAARTYYVYDASGERVRKITATGDTPKDERIYLGGFEFFRKFKSDSEAVELERETLHVMDDKQRIALVETKTLDIASPLTPHPSLVRYQLVNHLGSATLELDDQAKVISYEEFHPYGTTAYEAARSNTETPKRYRYTGKERDEETGFTYHGARYYAPWLGRWTSSDPSGLISGGNLYRSMACNPVRFGDPTGNEPQQCSVCLPPGTVQIKVETEMRVIKSGKVSKTVEYMTVLDTKQSRSSKRDVVETYPFRYSANGESENAPEATSGSPASAGDLREAYELGAQALAHTVVERHEAFKAGFALAGAGVTALYLAPTLLPLVPSKVFIGLNVLQLSQATGHNDPNMLAVPGVVIGMTSLAARSVSAEAAAISEASEVAVIEDAWEGSVGAAKGKPEFFERYVSEVEAKQIQITGKLEPKISPKGNVDSSPKRIGEPGAIDPRALGKAKTYSHKVTIKTKTGTQEWLQENAKDLTNEGHPRGFGIEQGEALDAFNERILGFEIKKVR